MEKETYKDIELRSEEVQEVMNRIPPAILRYGIGILASVVLVVLAGSALFRYPESVTMEVTVTTQTPPAYIKSTSHGRIERLYVKNGEHVTKGALLAVLENTADTEDMLVLRQRLDDWQKEGIRPERLNGIFFQRLPGLGSVQGSYASCLLAWNNYLQHWEESRIHETELNNAVAQLMADMSQWEKAYLPTAPINGQIAFMQPWKENQYVTADETVFVIVPVKDSPWMGKATLPVQSVGKVKTGQRTVVRLTGFPEQEYGFLEGKVASVSPVPDETGNYVVEIHFPESVRFNNGKELPILKVMTGTAEVIVRDYSLLERLFTYK